MKRIITCSDGTWNMPGDTYRGHVVRTNVQKIFEAICNKAHDGTHQLKYYDEGIGVFGNRFRKLFDGATGGGLDRNILDAYKFICWNYAQGDEIYLFGFSRGAYTARSLAGLIRTSGLVRNNDLLLIKRAYEIYRDRTNPGMHPEGDIATEFRQRHCQPDVRIKFIGVWDTVGSLGIPVKFLGNKKKYEFHDTTLSSTIDYAYQALAVDEKRKSFQPAIWQQSNSVKQHKVAQVLEQVWFPGVHSNIGGGYPDEGLSDIALQWLVDKAKATGLDFEAEYLRKNVNPASNKELYNSFVAPFSWLGAYNRPVMQDPYTNESVHESVYERMERVDDYRPVNIKKKEPKQPEEKTP
ncbi:DUF2235 domain-containing protein [Telluribacter sp. SYSU D00476]|uniref:DUF2235 domain-containing protein n=1 Tax=Telluribacter sp. SYSU D00476 TaxID=2811430 RepID=UPI001FF45A5C|nr:DUF2235 domain-containing protein [Telluribacter sp. SYSU D00476]